MGLPGAEVPPQAAAIRAWLIAWLTEQLEIPSDEIDADESLFSYGIGSVDAVSLSGDLERALGLRLPATVVWDHPTIAGLADYLAAQPAPEAASLPAPQPAADEAPSVYPLSYGQQELWRRYRADPAGATDNISFAARIRSPLDIPALRAACQVLLDRHPALRTVFAGSADQPVQQIQPQQEIAFTEVEAASWTEEELRARVADDYRRPFVLERGPALRVTLYTRGPRDHVLLLTVHYIVLDGWSLMLLLRELDRLYPALADGYPPDLASPPPISYADYVRAQAGLLAGAEGERLRAYWQAALGGARPALNLPANRRLSATPLGPGATYDFALAPELTAQVKALAQSAGTTLNVTLLAAFALLLQRTSGQDDIQVGSRVAARRPEWQALVGYLANSVVLRLDLAGDPPFRALLERVQRTLLGALAHEEYPSARLAADLHPEDPAASLYQAQFVLQSLPGLDRLAVLFAPQAPDLPAELGGLELHPFPVPRPASPAELALELWEAAGALYATFRYHPAQFTPATIARLARQYHTLLAGIVADPRAPIASFLLPANADSGGGRAAGAAQPFSFPQQRLVPELFEAQVARTPDAPAVVLADCRLTYGGLNQRANVLAERLRARGAGPNVVVGICLPCSPEAIVGLLGILKAGAAVLPLDPADDPERLAFRLIDSAAALLVTETGVAGRLPEHPAGMICLDADASALPQAGGANPRRLKGAQSLAYVLYTETAKPRPRAVLIEHRALAHLHAVQAALFGLGPGDRVLGQAAPDSPDAVFEILLALLSGAALCLAPPDAPHGGPGLAGLLNTAAITAALLPAAAVPALGATDLPALHTVIVADANGAADLTAGSTPGRRLCRVYGPPEAGLLALAGAATADGEPPALRPAGAAETAILDEQQAPVDDGVAGELYLGGPGLARGYLKRPNVTRARFLLQPAGAAPGARLFRTGQLARYRADGAIELLGPAGTRARIGDTSVNLRELEDLIGQHHQVAREVAVTAWEAAPGETRLAAYVVPNPGPAPTSPELRRRLLSRLPALLVPATLVVLDQLPRLPNGAINRRQLPPPAAAQMRPPAAFVRPRDGLERRICLIWEAVLNVRGVGVRDNFFELGGDSLAAVRLVDQIEQTLGQRPPLEALFGAATVEEMAAVLSQAGATRRWSSVVAIQRQGRRPPLFCIPGGGGQVFVFLDLARHLGAHQPLYGLQGVGLPRIEEQAARHVQDLHAVQPDGPYYLAGNSYGGLVAFEMAQQLHAAGREVALLALFDTYPPNHPLIRLLGDPQDLATPNQAALRAEFAIPAGDAAALPRSLAENLAANEQAQERYEPRVYPGRAVLFRASTQPRPELDRGPTHGWDKLVAGGVQVEEIPGTHGAIIKEPYVPALAARLRTYLG